MGLMGKPDIPDVILHDPNNVKQKLVRGRKKSIIEVKSPPRSRKKSIIEDKPAPVMTNTKNPGGGGGGGKGGGNKKANAANNKKNSKG